MMLVSLRDRRAATAADAAYANVAPLRLSATICGTSNLSSCMAIARGDMLFLGSNVADCLLLKYASMVPTLPPRPAVSAIKVGGVLVNAPRKGKKRPAEEAVQSSPKRQKREVALSDRDDALAKTLSTLTVPKLRAQLKERDLSEEGKKADLVKRLQNYLDSISASAPAGGSMSARDKELADAVESLKVAELRKRARLSKFAAGWKKG